MHSLVSTAWAAEALGAPDLVVADATLLDPALGRDARAEYVAGHIPGAVFMDLAALRDTASPLPNTLPDAAQAAAHLGALGIGDGVRVVLYDDSPWHSAARAWWLLRSYGLGDVAILDGGVAAWRAEGRPVETGTRMPGSRAFRPVLDPARLRTLAQMRTTPGGGEQVLDARSPARFKGQEADPHGAAPGHMPGARNLHYARLFDADGRWKRGGALEAEFAGVDPDAPLVATCGSGVTAGAIAFAAHLLGRDAAVYDGSWAEWGADPSTPKVTA